MPDQEQLIVKNTVATNLLKVIGTGIDFPLRFVAGNSLGGNSDPVGGVETSNAGERIRDSIHIILSTGIGERLHNPEFGSRLPQLVFEPNDEILKNLLRIYTAEALRRWEKRIEILTITILDDYNDDRNTVGIAIEYTIRNSHIKGSYVYPFVREGMPTESLYTGSEQRRMNNAGQVVL